MADEIKWPPLELVPAEIRDLHDEWTQEEVNAKHVLLDTFILGEGRARTAGSPMGAYYSSMCQVYLLLSMAASLDARLTEAHEKIRGLEDQLLEEADVAD